MVCDFAMPRAPGRLQASDIASDYQMNQMVDHSSPWATQTAQAGGMKLKLTGTMPVPLPFAVEPFAAKPSIASTSLLTSTSSSISWQRPRKARSTLPALDRGSNVEKAKKIITVDASLLNRIQLSDFDKMGLSNDARVGKGMTAMEEDLGLIRPASRSASVGVGDVGKRFSMSVPPADAIASKFSRCAAEEVRPSTKEGRVAKPRGSSGNKRRVFPATPSVKNNAASAQQVEQTTTEILAEIPVDVALRRIRPGEMLMMDDSDDEDEAIGQTPTNPSKTRPFVPPLNLEACKEIRAAALCLLEESAKPTIFKHSWFDTEEDWV